MLAHPVVVMTCVGLHRFCRLLPKKKLS
jgi:hypothetical protein